MGGEVKKDYRGDKKRDVVLSHLPLNILVAHNLNDVFIKEICLRTTVLCSVCDLSKKKGRL